MEAIHSKTLLDIENRVFSLPNLTTDTYDYQHLLHVTSNILTIANSNHLDASIAKTCALLHDHGRIISRVYGRPHAAEGARLAREWLNDYDIDPHIIDIICEAISYHNQKKEIHAPYCEILKNADSLAHKEESFELGRYEQLRAELALTPAFNFHLSTDVSPKKCLIKERQNLLKRLKQLKKAGMTPKQIHQYRIHTRRLRAMLWLNNLEHKSKKAKKLDMLLKNTFQEFEEPRQLRVLYKFLKSANATPLKKAVKKRLEIAVPNVTTLNKTIKKLSIIKCPVLKYSDSSISMVHKFYQTRLSNAWQRQDQIESLHRLRIAGKHLIYLEALGIIKIDQPSDLTWLKSLHKTIGQLNDIHENLLLLTSLAKRHHIKHRHLKNPQLADYVSSEIKELKREVRLLLFTANLRMPYDVFFSPDNKG